MPKIKTKHKHYYIFFLLNRNFFHVGTTYEFSGHYRLINHTLTYMKLLSAKMSYELKTIHFSHLIIIIICTYVSHFYRGVRVLFFNRTGF